MAPVVVALVTIVLEAFMVPKVEVVAFIVVPSKMACPCRVVIGVLVEIMTPLGLTARKLLVDGAAR